MESQIREWALARVEAFDSRRVWQTLPASFEHDAVRAAYESIKSAFTRRDIKERIAASKAATFAELYDAIKPKE